MFALGGRGTPDAVSDLERRRDCSARAKHVRYWALEIAPCHGVPNLEDWHRTLSRLPLMEGVEHFSGLLASSSSTHGPPDPAAAAKLSALMRRILHDRLSLKGKQEKPIISLVMVAGNSHYGPWPRRRDT